MKIVKMIQQDEEIKRLKSEFKKQYNKNAPPYNYDNYAGIDDYKEKLKN